MFEKRKERFTVKSSESFRRGDLSVLVDGQTGVQYLAFVGMGCSNLIPLLDRDGKPLVEPGPAGED